MKTNKTKSRAKKTSSTLATLAKIIDSNYTYERIDIPSDMNNNTKYTYMIVYSYKASPKELYVEFKDSLKKINDDSYSLYHSNKGDVDINAYELATSRKLERKVVTEVTTLTFS